MNRSVKLYKWLPFIVSLLYMVLYAYAAISKVLDFENFRTQLGQSPMLTGYAEIIAIGIPALELLLAIALSIGKLRIIALYISTGLMASFAMYIIVILNFSDYVPCSCGGILEHLDWTEHLIFNLVFVILGCTAIIYKAPNTKPIKRTITKIGTILFLCSSMVLGLFFYTDYKNHLSGSFIRLLPPHPISEVQTTITLENDQYQFSGVTKSHIYLNKKENPLELLMLDHGLANADTILLKLPKGHQVNLKRTTVVVNDLGVFVMDGTKPAFLKSNAIHRELEAIDLKNNFFNAAAIIDTSLLAITKLIPDKGRFLGSINTDNPSTHLNPYALEKQVDGFFCTDGYMHYNPQLQRLIYTYYYRNNYILLDKNLKVAARYQTIDTISTAKIKSTSIGQHAMRSLVSPPTIVNRRSRSWSHLFFNHSKSRAKNEPRSRLKNRSAIDVYNLKTGDYVLSFYIPHLKGQAIEDYNILNNHIFILYPDQLLRRELIHKSLTLSVNKTGGT